MFSNKTILITGGTGSLGKACIKRLLNKHNPKSLRIFSRDELKQWEIDNQFSEHPKHNRLRFFIGDVRDGQRVKRAFEGCDYVIHAAALKQIPAAEYNPMECVKTNILGSQNVIDAAIDAGVKKVVAISTDKAASPINLYGATKLCAEKLFISANNIKGVRPITFSVVRYGNVMGSRGSVIPFFLSKKEGESLTITDSKMTRFNITLDEAVDLVFYALKNSTGGEIFVPKIPSYRITDLAQAVAPNRQIKYTGIRPGEKLHEEMVTIYESPKTYETRKYYVILPSIQFFATKKEVMKSIVKLKAKKVKEGFHYSSDNNKQWLDAVQLRKLIQKHIDPTFQPIK